MDAVVRPATPPASGEPVDRTLEHPFVVPYSGGGPTNGVLPGQQDSPPGSSSSTFPRPASVQLSHNDDVENSVRNGPDDQQRDAAEPDRGSTRRSSESFTGNVLRVDSLAEQEVVVLTPSRLRLDSRVVLAHAVFSWLSNAFWAAQICQKLDGRLQGSWWAVFWPTIAGHVLHIPTQLFVFSQAEFMVYKQIGPPPPPSASPGLVLQYAILRHVRVRSHRVDWANNALESTAVFVVKMLFCDALERGKLGETSLRLMFTPIWVCWVITFCLLCLKDRTERMFGSSRDLFFIFLMFVAFRVDNQSSYSWRVVFLVPWMWFSGLLLVAAMVLLLLLFAKVWARPRELLLPIGFLLLLLSTVPQFVSYIALVRRLDGNTGTSIASILWPNALSWFLMFGSAVVIAGALRQKEAVRDMLLARGAVWTAHEGVARRLHAERDEAQRRVDELSEEEVARLVESMMAGKHKPGRLRRVGENLYKRIASLEPALAEKAAQAAGGSAPPSRTASTTSAATGGSSLDVAGGPEAATGSLPGTPTPQGAGAAADAAAGQAGDASVRRGGGSAAGGGRSGSGTGGGAAAPGGASGGGLSGLFRHNRVLPLGSPDGGQAAAGATGAVAAAAAAGEGEAVTAGSGASGALAGGRRSSASAAAGAAEAAAATAAVAGANVGQSAAPGRQRSGQNTWVAGNAAGTAGAGGGGGPSLELVAMEEGRDVESSGPGSSRNRTRSAAALSGSHPPPPPRSRGSSLPQVDARAPRPASEAGLAAGSASSAVPVVAAAGPATTTVTAAAAAAAAAGATQRRTRPPPLPLPLRRPASAVAAPVSGGRGPSAVAAEPVSQGPGPAAASNVATAATAAAGSAAELGSPPASARPAAPPTATPSAAPAASATRPRTASAPAAAAAAAAVSSARETRATGAPVPAASPRQSPTLAEEPTDAAASPHPATAGAGAPAAAGAVAGTPRGSGLSGDTGDGGERSGAPAAAAAVAGAPSASPASAMRSPAVLPVGDADVAAGQAEGSEGTDGPAAAAAGAATAAAVTQPSPEDIEAARAFREREAAGIDRPESTATHIPRSEVTSDPGRDPPGSGSGGAAGSAAGAIAAAAAAMAETETDNTCVICYDGEATCVFLECGHGGFCRRCAFLLFVRPPNECPTCRALIDQVVEIEQVAAVGEVAKVK